MIIKTTEIKYLNFLAPKQLKTCTIYSLPRKVISVHSDKHLPLSIKVTYSSPSEDGFNHVTTLLILKTSFQIFF